MATGTKGQPPAQPTSHLLQPPETPPQNIRGYFWAMKESGVGAREQLHKHSRAPTLPHWFTELRNSFSPHIAGRVEKAQMAQDLHLHEYFSKFSTQANPKAEKSNAG